MIELLLNLFALTLSSFSIINTFLAYTNNLSQLNSIISLILSFILAAILQRKDLKSLKFEIKPTVLFIGFLLVLLIAVVPNFIFPYTCSDLYNHARSTRVYAKEGGFVEGLIFAQGYPLIYYAVTSSLYLILGNTYALNTMLPIIMILFSSIAFFYLIKNLFNDRIALFSTLLFSFSITNFWILFMGFLPQIYGTFFLLYSLYNFYKKDKIRTILSSVGLIAYPHMLIIFAVFLAFKVVFSKLKIIEAAQYIIIPLILVFPESFSLLLWHLAEIKGLALIRGGGMVPNFFILISLIPVLFSFKYIKSYKNHKDLFIIIASIWALMLLTPISFIGNLIIKTQPPSISQFYIVVKLSYLLIGFLTVMSGVVIEKLLSKDKALIYALLTIYVLYFAFFPFAFPKYENFPQSIYPLAEYLDNLPGNFTLSIDSSLMLNDWKMPWYYNSLIDLPDDLNTKCPYIEAGRLFQFYWADSIFNNGMYEPYFNNNTLLYYDAFNTTYLITESHYNYTLVLQDDNLKLYKLD